MIKKFATFVNEEKEKNKKEETPSKESSLKYGRAIVNKMNGDDEKYNSVIGENYNCIYSYCDNPSGEFGGYFSMNGMEEGTDFVTIEDISNVKSFEDLCYMHNGKVIIIKGDCRKYFSSEDRARALKMVTTVDGKVSKSNELIKFEEETTGIKREGNDTFVFFGILIFESAVNKDEFIESLGIHGSAIKHRVKFI